jgi:hypothetical protein
MPIRFRCAYCNQLLGIARRKAGTVVRCPTCAGQVVVPNPQEVVAQPEDIRGTGNPLDFGLRETAPVEAPEPVMKPPARPRPGAVAQQAPEPVHEPIFERSDFDEVFNPVPAELPPARPAPPPAAAQAPPGAWSSPLQAEIDVEPFSVPPSPSMAPPPVQTPGILLSPLKATLLSVAVIMALAFAFAAGLLVGYFLRPAVRTESSRRPNQVHAALYPHHFDPLSQAPDAGPCR